MTENYDLSKLQQLPHNWVCTQIEYEGNGIAEFQKPKGQISGKTKIIFNESNEYLIEMEVGDLKTDTPLPLGLIQLLSSDPPKEENGHLSLPYPPSKFNICEKLTVSTKFGDFVAENIQWYGHSLRVDNEKGRADLIRFFPKISRFDASKSNDYKYWVMPLNNFISDFMEYDTALGNHPLRIFPDLAVPTDIPIDQKSIAEFIVRQKSRLILFTYDNALGFIEALPDYKEKENALKSRQLYNAITSVMIGEIGKNSINENEIENWFPFFFLDLLALATGSEVSTPWIEFRDGNGDLIRRIHGNLGFGRSLYIKGSRSIDEVLSRGTGRLLTVAPTSKYYSDSFLRVALRHVILGGRDSQTIEDKLDHLCRALDTLCEEFSFSTQNLLAKTSQSDISIINSLITKTTQAINSIRIGIEKSGDLSQNRYLHTIIGRLANVTNQDRKFGLAVCDLLNYFGFPDGDIIDKHYISNPRGDKLQTWGDVLSHYRGRVIHMGYFDFTSRQHEIDDIWSVIQHLHDILIRLIFILLGYDGEYCPTVSRFTDKQEIRWVKPDTPASRLGYL